MKLLLDTHTFIWWDSEPAKLPPQVLHLLQNPQHQFLLSVACVWEMQIKSQLGKLKLDAPLTDIVTGQQQTNRLEILPVTLAHVLALDQLPLHHKDPFDRLMIAQALVENAKLVSGDSVFKNYPVDVIW